MKMNNRLKFRVWDKITNQYLQELGIYYWHIPYSLDGEKITGEANLVGLSELLRHDNFVAQQYTGLNDINGKEVYDGDLVELHTAANDHAIGVKGNHCGLYEMYWDRCYKLKTIKPNWFFVPTFEGPAADYNIMKVVGNVFENPELLK
jgi:uncharacterized phage protein (TIGR01671 family)